MTKEELVELMKQDRFGLLESKRTAAPTTDAERLAESFEEINSFVDAHGREPRNSDDATELNLWYRLSGIRGTPEKAAALKQYDRHRLLEGVACVNGGRTKTPFFDDLLADGDEEEADIYILRNVTDTRLEAHDFVSRQKPCPDFEKYEGLFKACHADLKSGARRFEKFNERQVVRGQFFEFGGVLFYVDEVPELLTDSFGKRDGRTRVVLENGKMSNMLFRSFGKMMYKGGRHVSDSTLGAAEWNGLLPASEDAEPTGRIYVLASTSRDADVRSIKNLYKIGYCKTSVKERVKNAARDPTYLMAPVRIVMSYETYDANPQKFEKLLHKFFDCCRVEINVYDLEGKSHPVREWFQVPFEDIECAVKMTVSGEILNYVYDKERGIIPRK